MTMLSKVEILRGLSRLDQLAREAAVLVDLSVYGGAALAIAFDIRLATRDVDAVVKGSPDFLRAAALQVAEEEGWPADWLNDGVKRFTSGQEQMVPMEAFQGSPAGGLRIFTPAPEYSGASKRRGEGLVFMPWPLSRVDFPTACSRREQNTKIASS